MKYILHIAAALYIGGAEKVARDIGLFPDPDQYQNHYVVFGDKVGEYEQELIQHGCKIFHIDSPNTGYKKFVETLKDLIREYGYTAVHAHTMFNAGWAMYAAKSMGVPVRVAHAHSALENQGGVRVKLYEATMRHMILSCATDLVACGEKAGIRLFGEKAYRQRGRLILNGIDTEKYQFNEEKRREIRNRLGLEDSFVIGHVGHLTGIKNQKFLLERMSQILEITPHAKLLLLGDGEDRTMLEGKIAELAVQDCVTMTGNVPNVGDYLSAMDVFAFPSLFEGMPLSIVEVQANGLPCILSTGVPKDVYLTDLIQPLGLDEPEKWAEAICNGKRKNPQSYGELMKQSGFHVKEVMRKFYDVYERKT